MLDKWFKHVGGRFRQIRIVVNPEMRIRGPSPKSVILCSLEKLRKEIFINPYRKPTQVDEERILRRLGEL
jgi:hypothetical protein